MKRIIIIGANEFQNPLILKAKELGYETHVFAWSDGAVGEKSADFFYPISIVEKEKILEECRKIKPDAVVSIASDLAIITVNYLAKNLGLICNSEHSVLISTNKYEMRKSFRTAGIPIPAFCEVGEETSLEEITGLRFPVIVKPTDRSGSRGITKVDSEKKLKVALESALEYSFEKKAMVEEYLEGDEYSCECISYQGKHYCLAVTKKFTTGSPHFIETGHMEPSGLNEEKIGRIKKQIFRALDALEIQNGASHSEFKIDQDGEIKIIEVGARMGGDCIGSDLVQISTGYDFLKMTIQVALGEAPDIVKGSDERVAIVKFIFSKKDMEHLLFLKQKYPEKIYFISDMQMSDEHKIEDSSSRYGFYILACDSQEEAERLIRL